MAESRREFLLRSSGSAAAIALLARQIETFGSVVCRAEKNEGPGSGSDYKALVVLFLLGGNDGNNMVVPVHEDSSVSNYLDYSAARSSQGLAIPQKPLLPISVPRIGGMTYGLHPNLGPISTGINNGLHELFGTGQMAVVTNVGSLVGPLTKAQYLSPNSRKPYQLFSHPDQTTQAQTSNSLVQSLTGWGGRLSDRMSSSQNPGGLIPMITSIAGSQIFSAGQLTLPLAIADSSLGLGSVLNPAGFGQIPEGANRARLDALNALRTQDNSSNYIAAASSITELAIQANSALQTVGDVTVEFPNTSIGRQLKQVARIIKRRSDLKMRRQIFFVQIGGFDTHAGQPTQHISLLGQFSQAARAFYDEVVDQGIANNVTLMTLSDFGRTLGPTGQGLNVGSDHAWGNHMIVLGGSVAGGDFYGSQRPDGTGDYFPTLSFGGPDDTDTGSAARGRWIPTTSVDQYAVRFARWLGLPAAEENAVFQNLANFSSHDASNSRLDFLN